MKAYDLHVHSAFSGGESSLEELASMAKELGYCGICFTSYPLRKEEEEILKAEIKRVEEKTKIKILLGFEARNIKELIQLANRRREFDILLARGGDLNLNRKACGTPEVDILTHPEYNRNDSGLDHVSVRLAAENNVAIEINFREILLSTKRNRSIVLKNIAQNVFLAKKFGAKIILCSGAISCWELRAPECLVSMACQLGLEYKEAKDAITNIPSNIIKMIEERKDEKWIMPGVKIVR
ncbi:MAG: RNase P subunit p30 family protein [Candidatus Aenigmatarchaeota archaeon]